MTSQLCAVVVTHNSYRDKGGCVEHALILLQQQDNWQGDIVVVDNGSQAEDNNRLKEFLRHQSRPVTLVECHTSLSQARNLGAEAARGNVLLFMDDDCLILRYDALSQIHTAAQTHSHGYGARRDWTPGGGWFAQHSVKIKDQLLKRDTTFLSSNLGLPEPSLRQSTNAKHLIRSFLGHFGFVRRELFNKVGGYPTLFKGYGHEDGVMGFLCYRTNPSFASLRAIRIAHVSHPVRTSSFAEEKANHKHYLNLLRHHGVKEFHATRLIYPELAESTCIIEYFTQMEMEDF